MYLMIIEAHRIMSTFLHQMLLYFQKQVDILISKNQALQILYLKHRVYSERSGYSSVTRHIPLQAIRPALNDFCIGFTSMVGAQATKGYG